MSNPVMQIINDITATGARFVLDADGVGLDRIIPDDLLELARQHKFAIKRELEAQSGSRRFLTPSPHTTLRAAPHRAVHQPLG
ncbi:hypothetical protein [Thiothrix subterranea]|uniref:TubC N-terminal docking domain-containing protein n=1 Tax=Thiothrix subterranea TaxID=2735563 RepID=A0ABU0YDK0_9GAMM|nr:hypothetical protein [Thiothrix subterranea]MDQ5770818.1 hypothetical protein [Thiothrix subterranea]